MKKRDPIVELVRKYGKRESEVKEDEKLRMVEIVFENPREVYYVPSEKFHKLERRQALYELEEIDRG